MPSLARLVIRSSIAARPNAIRVALLHAIRVETPVLVMPLVETLVAADRNSVVCSVEIALRAALPLVILVALPLAIRVETLVLAIRVDRALVVLAVATAAAAPDRLRFS